MRSAATTTLGRRLGRSRSVSALTLSTVAPALAIVLTASGALASAPAAHADYFPAGPADYVEPTGCTTVGLVTTCAFGFTGAPQDWTVPRGVDRATVTVIGGRGGDSSDRPGGAPGGTVASIATTPGQVLRLFVGEGGGRTGRALGGWNGGADSGGSPAGGGGGASDVRVAPYGPANRILVAGGGGGAGARPGDQYRYYYNFQPGAGGNGGGTGQTGYQGQNVAGSPGAGGGGGGTATAGGFNGGAPGWPAPFGCDYHVGASGSSGQGGRGGYLSGAGCGDVKGFGGGGGGGWYGGGGGGGGGVFSGAGGGGGSGYGPAGSTSFAPDRTLINGKITISFRDPSRGWVDLAGGGQLTSAPTAVMRPAGPWQPEPQQDVFYLNQNSRVTQRVVTDGVPSPEYDLGTALYPGSTIAAVWRTGGRLDLFGRGTESALWQKSYSSQTGWGPWVARTPAGTLTSSPAVASPAAPRLDVFFRGSDNLLTQLTSTAGVWAAPNPLAFASIGTAPSAVTTGDVIGRMDVYAGCNGALCRYTYDNSSIKVWGPVPGTSVAAPPTVSSSTPGQVQVAVRDHNNRVILWQNRGSGWSQADTGQAPSPLAPSLDGQAIGQAPMSASNTIFYARGPQGTLTARTIVP